MGDRAQLLNDNEEGFRLAFEGKQVAMWTASPGIVVDVNLGEMTCSVKLAILATIENEDGTTQSVEMPPLIHVPIVFPSAGGFTITMPIAAGDEVLVVFSSRCIDAWWQSGGVQKAMEARMHDLSDGFAIPGPKSIPKKISSISSSALQVRSNDGTTYLEVAADGTIKLVAPSGVTIEGDLNVTGDITADHVTASGIGLTTHHHTGVTTGGSNTGGPV